MVDGGVTVATLKEILAAFNRHDLDGITEFFAEDCVLEMPRGPHPWSNRFVGKASVREGLASRFAGLPDVHYSNDRHWVGGDFSYGTRLLAYRAFDAYCLDRVRRFLVRRHHVPGRGTQRFSDPMISGALGVFGLRRVHPGAPPWALR